MQYTIPNPTCDDALVTPEWGYNIQKHCLMVSSHRLIYWDYELIH